MTDEEMEPAFLIAGIVKDLILTSVRAKLYVAVYQHVIALNGGVASDIAKYQADQAVTSMDAAFDDSPPETAH